MYICEYRLRIGLTDVVLVNGSTAVREVLKNDDILGRPKIAVFEFLRAMMVADREFGYSQIIINI